MNTCKTCRWWGPNQPEFDAKENSSVQGVCICPKVHFAVIGHDDDFNEHLVDKKTDHALESDEVGVKDGSGYFAAMFTGPDFGCVHHQTVAHAATKCQRCGGDVGCICVSRGSIPRMEAAGIPWSEIDGHIVPGFCSVCEALTHANAIEAQALTPQPPIANNTGGESLR